MSSSASATTKSQAEKKPEDGDYIINWHLQYCANVMFQGESYLRSISDQIKAELMKIKTDGEFVKENLPGNHSHLIRLKNEDRDLRSALDPIHELMDLFKLIAHRSAERIM